MRNTQMHNTQKNNTQKNKEKKLDTVLTPSECINEDSEVCASNDIQNILVYFVNKKTNESENSPLKALEKAEELLDCDGESCVITHPEFKKYASKHGIREKDIQKELHLRYKTYGPRNSTELLNNYNIDDTLRIWARKHINFFPCPFAMMDFDTNGDLFGKIKFDKMLDGYMSAYLGPSIGDVKRKFNCMGCVVNTDVSTGPGIHWVAVFVDCRSYPWTIEYFNSVGRPPPKVMVNWMEKNRAHLINYLRHQNIDIEVKTISVTNVDHQDSQTECGLYSLFYIRKRLEGANYTYFMGKQIPDELMIEFRKRIFRKS